ncbi:hypothetical protein Tco_0571244 [Tanacetum coccineum]
MSTQQDIYVVGSENRPPMPNKDNYVPWSSRLLRYTKSKPNEKLIYNSIMHGPYVKRMIPKPSDPDREVPVAKIFHEQTDDELTEKDIKQMQIVGGNQVVQNAVQNPSVQNVRNQNGLIVVSGITNQNANQIGNGNVVAARAKGDLNEIEEVNANCILMVNLQQALTSGTQTDKASVYDSDGLAKVHHSENCSDNDIFNMFTQEEIVEQSGGTIEQPPTTAAKTRVYFESLYNNLAIEVISTYIDSCLENIDQFLNGFTQQPNEIDEDNLEPDDELVDTPLVYPFLDSDDDFDDGEVLNELEEYDNVG